MMINDIINVDEIYIIILFRAASISNSQKIRLSVRSLANKHPTHHTSMTLVYTCEGGVEMLCSENMCPTPIYFKIFFQYGLLI